MKHKAQEFIDEFQTMRCTESINGTEIEPPSWITQGLKNIQDTIDCQLTWEQSGVLYLMVCGMCDRAKKNDDLEAVRELEKIKSKLLKQKEMWVSEDESI